MRSMIMTHDYNYDYSYVQFLQKIVVAQPHQALYFHQLRKRKLIDRLRAVVKPSKNIGIEESLSGNRK